MLHRQRCKRYAERELHLDAVSEDGAETAHRCFRHGCLQECGSRSRLRPSLRLLPTVPQGFATNPLFQERLTDASPSCPRHAGRVFPILMTIRRKAWLHASVRAFSIRESERHRSNQARNRDCPRDSILVTSDRASNSDRVRTTAACLRVRHCIRLQPARCRSDQRRSVACAV